MMQGGERNLRWAPTQEQPCEAHLLRVIAYMWSKAVDHAAKVTVGAENDIRGFHEVFQWE